MKLIRYIVVVGMLFLMGCVADPHGFWFNKGDHLICPQGHIVYTVETGQIIDGMRCKLCGSGSAAFFPRVATEEEVTEWEYE